MKPEVRSVDINDRIPGSVNFKWAEALWLPCWQIYCYPSDAQAQEIIRLAQVMDSVRNRCGAKPVNVTSWLRPLNYNQWPTPYGVSGAKQSAHCLGQAVDFTIATKTSNEVREILRPELERLKIRMENLPGSHWVHIDRREPGGGGRYFIP